VARSRESADGDDALRPLARCGWHFAAWGLYHGIGLTMYRGYQDLRQHLQPDWTRRETSCSAGWRRSRRFTSCASDGCSSSGLRHRAGGDRPPAALAMRSFVRDHLVAFAKRNWWVLLLCRAHHRLRPSRAGGGDEVHLHGVLSCLAGMPPPLAASDEHHPRPPCRPCSRRGHRAAGPVPASHATSSAARALCLRLRNGAARPGWGRGRRPFGTRSASASDRCPLRSERAKRARNLGLRDNKKRSRSSSVIRTANLLRPTSDNLWSEFWSSQLQPRNGRHG